MTRKEVELLRSLVLEPSPSGFEHKIAQLIVDDIPGDPSKRIITRDRQNNVCVTILGKTTDVVMIDAHMDQTGFVVNNIDSYGQINLTSVGDTDASILSGKNLVILTENGHVNAVVNRKAAHQVREEADEMVEHTHSALVDIGIRGREKVNKIVEIGDPAVYRPTFEHLAGDFYTGSALDDKVGCFVLLETIRNILRSKKVPESTLVFTFSAQEETGGRKCRPLVKQFQPYAFIEVDVTFASDWNEEDQDYSREVGTCILGEGPVLYRGVGIDPAWIRLLRSTAKTNRIPIQLQASTGQIGYTATEVSHENDGIRAIIVGLPLRNMHVPVEIVNGRDLTKCVQLLSKCLLSRQVGRI